MRDGLLFDKLNPVPASDTHVVEPAEQKRLTGQNERILVRLRQGPVTNAELATMALKYTSRLSDLRAAGYDVRVIERNHETGVTTYRLIGGPK